jgi:hypothetical protein
LTALPAEYREALKVEQAFLRMVRRAGIEIEWAIAHELTKRGQRHGHALCKGDYLPQRSASRFAERAGMGRVLHIERIRDEGGTSYALKEALRVVGYTTKGTVASLGAHLDLNGGRICRTTRGYFTA